MKRLVCFLAGHTWGEPIIAATTPRFLNARGRLVPFEAPSLVQRTCGRCGCRLEHRMAFLGTRGFCTVGERVVGPVKP